MEAKQDVKKRERDAMTEEERKAYDEARKEHGRKSQAGKARMKRVREEAAEQLANAEPVLPPLQDINDRLADATECTEVADVTDADYRLNGLAPGEYACPKPVDYDWCAAPTRHFVDDAGTRHSTHRAAPTVVVNINDALGLQDMGLTRNQVHGTIGQRTSTYSNFGQREGSSAEVYTNSGETEWDPSQFTQDAYTAEELHMIARAIDMTPSCAGLAASCTGETGEIIAQLDAHGWPDFMVVSAYGTSNYFTCLLYTSPSPRDRG